MPQDSRPNSARPGSARPNSARPGSAQPGGRFWNPIAPGLAQELAWDWHNLILHRACPICGEPAATDLCRTCDRHLNQCAIANPKETWQGEFPVFAWGYYRSKRTPILKRSIAALKYDNHPILARTLGYRIGQAWNRTRPLKAAVPRWPRPLVVPIPLHDRKLRSRGFNQAALLARYFCRVARLPCAEQGLVRVQDTQALFGLDRPARQAEVQEAFRVGSVLGGLGDPRAPGLRIPGALIPDRFSPGRSRPVLLFDDIYTTGATVQAAAQTLQAQGITVLGVVVLARAGG
ncbi:MAG: hypothetical protein VKJ85_09640 [Prochlorothrix sp.]|nr:hypothetical protein [Prochlorothrix sp.]